MYNYIHNVKQIVKSEIKEVTKENTGEKYYVMDIAFFHDELGTCRERHSKNTMYGDMEVKTSISLFADTKEALELKAEALA